MLISIILTLSFVGCSSHNTPKDNTHQNNISSSPQSPKINKAPVETKTLQDSQEIKVKKPEVKSEIKPFMPTHLIIPAIHVSAKIVPVGLLKDGQMAVPKETNLVGMLQPGILAGQKGNMIFDGHVDSYTGPAIFFNLKKLKHGDRIIVRNKKTGRQLTYTVESVEIYATSEAPEEKIFGETDDSRLNLITCTGKYSRKKKEHEKRLVVYTKLE